MGEQPLVAYYRVSTRQQKKSGLGLEAQKHSVRRYLKTCAGNLIAELTEAESGRNNDRSALKEALWYCRVYGAKLVVAKLDRLARSAALIAALMESGVDFVAADVPMANRFTLHLLAAVAEYEARLISERTKAAFAAAKARGTFKIRSRESYGKPSKVVSEKALRVRRELSLARARDYIPLICKLRDRGESITGIVAQLTTMEIAPPPRCKKWHLSTIKRMLRITGERPPKSGRGRRPDRSGMRTPLLLPLLIGPLSMPAVPKEPRSP
jgi:DNA invertase Pin-like site-specific DNA recombinase